jgi:hypothetical protein
MVLGLRQEDVVLESDGGAGLAFQLTLLRALPAG